MASGTIPYQITPPTYSSLTVVYTKTGTYNGTFTIPKTGWYAIQMLGYWGSTRVQINGVSIASAQCRASDVAIGVTNTCFFTQGTVLTIDIQNSNGNVSIVDIN